ncbi:hypothetical protein ACLB2K_027387 [Fragaria x ananassa]
MFDELRRSMMEFDMTDLGMMHYFLGIEVVQSDAGIFIKQKKYAQEVLEKFEMKGCNSVATPAEPGLKLASDPKVSVISRFMEQPSEKHVLALKRAMFYLQDAENRFYPGAGGMVSSPQVLTRRSRGDGGEVSSKAGERKQANGVACRYGRRSSH